MQHEKCAKSKILLDLVAEIAFPSKEINSNDIFTESMTKNLRFSALSMNRMIARHNLALSKFNAEIFASFLESPRRAWGMTENVFGPTISLSILLAATLVFKNCARIGQSSSLSSKSAINKVCCSKSFNIYCGNFNDLRDFLKQRQNKDKNKQRYIRTRNKIDGRLQTACQEDKGW